MAFAGAQLDEAKAGILAAPVGAAAATWLVLRTIGLLSQRRRTVALLGGAEPLLDLEFAVDPESDHILTPSWPHSRRRPRPDHCAFWEMHDQLLAHQDKLRIADLVSYADRLGLDVPRLSKQLHGHVGASRIAQDVEGADLSRVSGTPTFFNQRASRSGFARSHGRADVAARPRADAERRGGSPIRKPRIGATTLRPARRSVISLASAGQGRGG